MEIIKLYTGEFAAKIKSNRKPVRLRCYTEEDAKAVAEEMNLERVERMAINETITRDLIRSITGVDKVPVSIAIERWCEWLRHTSESRNTHHNFYCYAKAWMRDSHSRNVGIDEITEADLDAWINKKDGSKAATRRFRLTALRSLFGYCAIKQYIQSDISKLVKVKYADLSHEQKESKVNRVFTSDEYSKLISFIKSWDNKSAQFWLFATILGRHTALRLGDIATLQRSSFQHGRLVVHTDKINTRVDQEITPEIQEAISIVPAGTGKYCFNKFATIASDPSSRAFLSVFFGRILRKAGIENHHFHELRATRITELSQAGQDIKYIAGFAGHSSTKTTELYIVNNSNNQL